MILQNVRNLPPPPTTDTMTLLTPSNNQLFPNENETAVSFAVRSFNDLRNYMTVQLDQMLPMEVGRASDTAAHYVETLVTAKFNYFTLRDTIIHFRSPDVEYKGETVQSVYGHLLDCLRDLSFEKYPKTLSENHLDTHLINIARLSLDYFTRRGGKSHASCPPSPHSEAETGLKAPPSSETGPVGGNTVNQLPQRRYILATVSVDTVPVDGRSVIWQISLYIPGLPDDKDPDYECLMLPHIPHEKQHVLADLGFTYDWERNVFYHQGTEFGRRLVDPEEVALEKFTNYLDEIRNGLSSAGPNNGLVLIFETGEDLALVQQLFFRHGHDIFLDVVKGITCLDQYMRVTRSVRSATYTWPTYQYRAGKGGCWIASVSWTGNPALQIEAETKPECIYSICESLLGKPLSYHNFIKWYSYPVNHSEIRCMSARLKHILELLPLQNHIDKQLVMNNVPVVLAGIYASRSEVDAARPHSACARQTIRRLVSFGFTLDVLNKLFRIDPKYEVPAIIFLQDMSEVHKLLVHHQSIVIGGLIKQYFVRTTNI
jgi:hypothetical protein